MWALNKSNNPAHQNKCPPGAQGAIRNHTSPTLIYIYGPCPKREVPSLSRHFHRLTVPFFSICYKINPKMGIENLAEKAQILIRSRLCSPNFIFKPLSDSSDSNYRCVWLSRLLGIPNIFFVKITWNKFSASWSS